MKKIYARPAFEVVSMREADVIATSKVLGAGEGTPPPSMDAKRHNAIWDEE